MDAEVTLFSKPEELIAWADTFDILLNPSIEDAAILLNYMEGHDYAIGIDSDGKMYRQDVAEENGEIEPYPIDDVIYVVYVGYYSAGELLSISIWSTNRDEGEQALNVLNTIRK